MHRYLKAIGSRVLGTQRESPGYGLLATGLLFLIVHDWLMKQERHAAVTAFQFFFFFLSTNPCPVVIKLMFIQRGGVAEIAPTWHRVYRFKPIVRRAG